jgi:hypothetical protein
MKIQDLLKDWRSLSWSGTYAGMDRTDAPNAATTIIEDVQVMRDNKDKRILGISVKATADNRPVSDRRTVYLRIYPEHDLGLPPEDPIFDRLVTALKSAIGKTLNDSGNINI